MALYYSALGKAKLAAKRLALSGSWRLLSKVPGVLPLAHRSALWVRKVLVPERSEVWVTVEAGLAKGLELRLNLVSESSFWLGIHERPAQEILANWLTRGCVFYDVGSHFGFFSLAVARLLGPEGKVFAFEPDPENGARFRTHLSRNNLGSRVQLVEAAAWSEASPQGIRFQRGGRRATHGGVQAEGNVPVLADGEAIQVPTCTLSGFVESGHPLPDIVKIDVEGGECEVLKGAEGVFASRKPKLICEVHHEAAARWIADWLAAHDYAGQWQVPAALFPRLLVAETKKR